MSYTELKPCPFCGSSAELEPVGRDWFRVAINHSQSCPIDDLAPIYPQTDMGAKDLISSWEARHVPIEEAEKAADSVSVPVALLEKLLVDNMRRSINWRSSAIGDLRNLLREHKNEN